MINLKLAKERKVSDKYIMEITLLHDKRDWLYNTLYACKELKGQAYLGQMMEVLERRLQKLWGFEIDASYTKFWRLPHCTCPQMDTEDMLMPGPIYDGDCPLHKHHVGG